MNLAVLILGFALGGVVGGEEGAKHVRIDDKPFELAGFVGYSVKLAKFPDDYNPSGFSDLSSLMLGVRLGYNVLKRLGVYGFGGISTFNPLEDAPKVVRTGFGLKISILPKERNVNFNVDAQFELMPNLIGAKQEWRVIPMPSEWTIIPTVSFHNHPMHFYAGVGYSGMIFRVMVKDEDGKYEYVRLSPKMTLAVGVNWFLTPGTYAIVEIRTFAERLIVGGISTRF